MFPSMVGQKSHNCDSLQHAKSDTKTQDDLQYVIPLLRQGRYAYGIWYPIECDMGLDDTLTSHIERVPDESSKPISHENVCRMHFLARNNLKFKFHEKAKLIWNITNTGWEPQSAVWRQMRTVLNIETRPWSARRSKMILFTVYHASEYEVAKIRECRRWAFWVCRELSTLLFGKNKLDVQMLSYGLFWQPHPSSTALPRGNHN